MIVVRLGAIVLLAAVSVVCARTAGAQILGGNTPLLYAGGPITGDPTVYNIFWLPPGQHFEPDPTRDAVYEGLLNGFIKDLDGSPFLKPLDQYSKDPKGNPIQGGPITGHVTLGGSWVDTEPYPHAGSQADPLLNSDLQTAIESAMSANGWTSGLNKVYFVYPASLIDLCYRSGGPCFSSGAIGAHYSFKGGDSPLLGAVVGDYYSFFPRLGLPGIAPGSTEPSGDPYADTVFVVIGHELVEAMTDPVVGIFYEGTVNQAWTEGPGDGHEIADICEPVRAEMTIGAHVYMVQAAYSNVRQRCVFSDPSLPVRLKLAYKSVLKGKKQKVTITTAANARLTIRVLPYGHRLARQAGPNGKYVMQWTPKFSTVSQVIVSAATNDGLGGLSQAVFTGRKR